jgi:hypothetical protein
MSAPQQGIQLSSPTPKPDRATKPVNGTLMAPPVSPVMLVAPPPSLGPPGTRPVCPGGAPVAAGECVPRFVVGRIPALFPQFRFGSIRTRKHEVHFAPTDVPRGWVRMQIKGTTSCKADCQCTSANDDPPREPCASHRRCRRNITGRSNCFVTRTRPAVI